MHSKIIQISKEPIEEENYISESDYYESFVGSIADYVADLEDDEVESEKRDFISSLEKRGIVKGDNGNEFTIVNKTKFFEGLYEEFVSHVQKLADATLEAFCNGKLDDAMYCLNTSYKNKYDIYIDDKGEWYGLVPLSEFMRSVNNGETFYLGGAVDYHA